MKVQKLFIRLTESGYFDIRITPHFGDYITRLTQLATARALFDWPEAKRTRLIRHRILTETEFRESDVKLAVLEAYAKYVAPYGHFMFDKSDCVIETIADNSAKKCRDIWLLLSNEQVDLVGKMMTKDCFLSPGDVKITDGSLRSCQFFSDCLFVEEYEQYNDGTLRCERFQFDLPFAIFQEAFERILAEGAERVEFDREDIRRYEKLYRGYVKVNFAGEGVKEALFAEPKVREFLKHTYRMATNYAERDHPAVLNVSFDGYHSEKPSFYWYMQKLEKWNNDKHSWNNRRYDIRGIDYTPMAFKRYGNDTYTVYNGGWIWHANTQSYGSHT